MGGHDAELILVAGALLAAGTLAALLAERMRVPGLLLFLALGMLAGSEGIGGLDFSDAELARTLGTIALILILFEGGLTAGWSEIRPVLGTASSLALVGTTVTALVAGLAAKWIFDLSTLEGMIVGAAIAATDSAAIFAVLRRSTLEKRLARSLEGESGMNDPVALLLVIGFIEWIQQPGYGAVDMAGLRSAWASAASPSPPSTRCACPPMASIPSPRSPSPASPTVLLRSRMAPAS
jgi:cell volume regulation protein A